MKKEKTEPSIVRLTISLPPDLAVHALIIAREEHCGNLSAYIRSLLQAARRKAQTSAPRTNNHAAA